MEMSAMCLTSNGVAKRGIDNKMCTLQDLGQVKYALLVISVLIAIYSSLNLEVKTKFAEPYLKLQGSYSTQQSVLTYSNMDTFALTCTFL